MDGSTVPTSTTATSLARIIATSEDVDALLQVWNVLVAVGAQNWEVDTPEPCALRMRILGVQTFDMNVYTEIVASVNTLRDVFISLDGVDVWVWKHDFKQRSPLLAPPPTTTTYTTPKVSVKCPDWCDKKERRTVTSFINNFHCLVKYSPKLDIDIKKAMDGLRYTLTVSGLQKVTLHNLHSICKSSQSTIVTITSKTITINVVCYTSENATCKTGIKRSREHTSTTQISAFKLSRPNGTEREESS